MDYIEYTDFAKVDFRIGEIVEAKKVEDSEKLIRMRVDFGQLGIKTVFSGIAKHYSPEELLNKKTVFVVNIKPRKIMGEESEAMIFAGESDDEKTISIMILDKDLSNGSKVF